MQLFQKFALNMRSLASFAFERWQPISPNTRQENINICLSSCLLIKRDKQLWCRWQTDFSLQQFDVHCHLSALWLTAQTTGSQNGNVPRCLPSLIIRASWRSLTGNLWEGRNLLRKQTAGVGVHHHSQWSVKQPDHSCHEKTLRWMY